MQLEYFFVFVVGGLITLAITYLEASGFPLLSRLAALFPIFTWLSYLFISKLSTPKVIAGHTLFVLLGTLFAWVPYMLTIYFFSEKIGTTNAIVLGLTVFIILAVIFVKIYPV